MNAKQALQSSMDMSLFVLNQYISDLSDEELLRRPTEGCNHLAWQLGHLIGAEASLLDSICPGKAAELPDGFSQQHSKETCQSDDPDGFLKKQE